jgi:hypothetical protein
MILHIRLIFSLIFFATCLLIMFSEPTFACRPSAQHRYPSLKENFQRAKAVAFVEIKKVESLGSAETKPGEKFRIEFKVNRHFKGKVSSSTVEVTSNSCDTLGMRVFPGLVCLFFLTSENQVISGVLSGMSTVCSSSAEKKDVLEFQRDWKKQLKEI